MRYKVFFVTGGTGGHIFPAISVAKEIDFPYLFITGKYGMEKKIFEKENVFYKTIPIKGLSGISFLKKTIRLPNLLFSLVLSFFYILKFKPSIIFAFGGYVSFPILFWAKFLKKKYFLQEQNSIPGFVTKYFSKKAEKIFTGFPEIKLEGKKVFTGNPLRKEFYEIELKKEISFPLNIFIIGGSQGSNFLDETILKVLPNLKGKPIKIIHQVRSENFYKLKKEYNGLGIEYEIFDFTDKPWVYYKDADIIICRAGALTVSEVISSGRCAIFIPFKGATDNHQFYNAKFLSDADASFLIEENEKTSENLIELLEEIIKKPEITIEMGKKAKERENRDGLKIIKESLLRALGVGKNAF